METVVCLLKARAEVMAAQAKATAVQNLPNLSWYTGEGGDTTDDGFDRWVERFRERAKVTNRSVEDQFKHLDKTALGLSNAT